jgi:plastocyanin
MPRNLAAVLSAGAMALAVAACGSSSSNSSSAAAANTSAGSSSAAATSSAATGGSNAGGSSHLSISANQGGALMFSTNTLTAKAGTVTITFTNDSPEGHNFTIDGPGDKKLAATPTFMGGAKTITVKLAAGKYMYECSVPGHAMGGMMGTLTVT